MLYNERAEYILQQLQLQSTVKVSELSRQLQVSVDTVRRDLKTMEQGGQIRCVRGGACLRNRGFPSPILPGGRSFTATSSGKLRAKRWPISRKTTWWR